LAAVLTAPLSAQTPFDLSEVGWTMRAEPDGSALRMEMQLNPLHERDRVVLRMPLWRPGSYNYAQFQRKVSELKAIDQGGKERAILPCDDRSWQVDARGATRLTVSYKLGVENVADAGAPPAIMRNGPATFLYVEDALNLPHTLSFDLPAGWQHASGHRAHPLREGVFYSPNYDVFVDCPLILGDFERYEFTLHERPFEVVLYGKRPTAEQFNRAAWVETVKKISAASYDVVGDFPFERYAYLFGFTDIGGGYGLEHLNSTTIEFNHGIVKSGNLESLESVTAHEFFHLWNVKRIRPEILGPFDYATDARTKDLWWMEGVTSYYNDVILQRAGLRSAADWFVESQAQVGRTLQGAPGYGKLSPERASWTVWDGTGNQISYYDQGQALGFLLDVQIRHHTGNARSLDDVVRFLHRWVNYPDAGLRPGDLERAVRAISGWDCSEFFDRYVEGNQRFPYAEVVRLAGLNCLEQRIGDPYLGIALDEKLVLTRDEESAGLKVGDQLVRVAGAGVRNQSEVQTAAAQLKAGEQIELIVERAGAGRVKIPWTVKERDRSSLRLWVDEAATAAQKAILSGILSGNPAAI
jgi:predicted metalloprotease with PDZ domain